MVAVVWITEATWEACIDHAREVIPDGAEVKLVHVSPIDVESLVSEGTGGLLGRPAAPSPAPKLEAIADEEAHGLLEAARARFGRPAALQALRGHPEREVLRECGRADLLVLARDGGAVLGPKSLSRQTRFVLDHASSAVLLIWPQKPSDPQTVKLPPHVRG